MSAPDFTPSSYPPALRIRFFAQHLREFGWEPIVLATDPRYYEWSVDSENEKLLPADLEVIRTRALPAEVTRKVGIGDLGFRSFWHQWRALSRLCRKREINLIFIPVPPNPSMALGRLAHARFGVPYVIDYIDPVVSDRYWKVPRSQRPPKHALSYVVNHMLERFALRRVSQLVAVDRSYVTDVFKRYRWLKGIEASGIPYGGEPSDFDYLRKHPRPNSMFDGKDGLIHVSYVGRGGMDMDSTLRALFRAVKVGLKRTPSLFRRMRMHFVGTTYAPNAAGQYQVLLRARAEGVESVVNEHPARVSYLEAIQILLDSNALVVPGSEAAHYTASKIFPYILARKPLLAIFHEESSVVGIVRQTGQGRVITFSDDCGAEQKIEEIELALEELLMSRPNDQRPLDALEWLHDTIHDSAVGRGLQSSGCARLNAIFILTGSTWEILPVQVRAISKA